MSSQEEILTDLPVILRESPEFKEMARVQGKIFDRLEGHIDDVLNNTFIDDAIWGLSIMEKEFKIPTDVNKPLDQRRSVLKAKKRGIGTVSASLIKSVAESFRNGSVEVKAIKGQSKILVTFNDVYGIPPNLEDIKQAIRKILPAHRVIEFQFKYLLIKDVQKMTLAEMEATPLNKFAGGA
ncbi:putative phage tail protein [Bacillus sp. REN10]|uniref:putative phage tail protein n=1 Tax=Bacillus sp. REN10 TaxID=2782541 RepID=UPI00193BEC22